MCSKFNKESENDEFVFINYIKMCENVKISKKKTFFWHVQGHFSTSITLEFETAKLNLLQIPIC
jgi:hypothetical protein